MKAWNTNPSCWIVLWSHIIPKVEKYSDLYDRVSENYTEDDVYSPRNSLMLASGIKYTFDRLWLCFSRDPENVLSDQLYLRIHNMKDCDELALYEGSDKFVGQYNNFPLLLNGHIPFRSALYQHEFASHGNYEVDNIDAWSSDVLLSKIKYVTNFRTTHKRLRLAEKNEGNNCSGK